MSLNDRAMPTSALTTACRLLLFMTVLLLPWAAWPDHTNYLYTKWLFAIWMISAVSILWGLELVFLRNRVIRPPLLVPLTALGLAAALSLANGSNLRLGLESLVLYVGFVGLYVVTANTVRSLRDGRSLLMILVASGTGVCLYALAQYVGALPGPSDAQGVEAMIATLGNKNFVAELAAVLLLPGGALWLTLKGRRPARLLLALGLIAMAAALAVARAELALMAMLLALVVIAGIVWLGRRSTRVGLSVALAALPIVGVVAASVAVAYIGAALPDGLGTESTRSLLTRAFTWRAGIETFLEHPWLGVGWGHFQLHFLEAKAELMATDWGQAFDFTVSRSIHTHQDYLQAAAEMGIVGLGALAWVVAGLLGGLRRTAARPLDNVRILQLGLYGGLIAWLIDAAVNFPMHRPASALALVALAGVLHSPGMGTASAADPWETPEGERRRWPRVALLVAIVLVCLPTATLAYRDLRANILLEAGQRHLAVGTLETAQTQLSRGAQLAFDPSAALFHLGRVHIQRGQHRQAIKPLERSLHGRVAEGTYLLLAQAHHAVGQNERAWRYVDQLLATNPHPLQKVPAYHLRAQLYRQLGEADTALAQLEHAIRLQPDFVDAHRLMARIHADRGDRQAAMERYERALEVAKRKLAQRRKSLQDRLTGEGIPEAEWHQTTQAIATLEDQIEAIRDALSRLESDPK